MECNKDEAERAKGIAERKFTEKDYVGAKKFALKAQNLYPQLEGVSQMLTTFEVYVSAENKLNGETDWYAVLGVDPWASDDIVRKQYRKLALMLHPDKNKSKGADGAFKLVSEAWSVLSDKAKRLTYNQKRSIRATQQKFPPTQGGVTSQTHNANGFSTSRHYTNSSARARNNSARVNATTYAPPPPPPQKSGTFWTICNGCKTQYEYLRIYLNQTLLCPNCREAFLAVEKAAPPNVLKSSNWSSHQQHQNSKHQVSNRNTYNPGRHSAGLHTSNDSIHHWSSIPRTGGVNSRTASPSTAAQAASVVQEAHNRVKREFEAPQVSAEWDASKGMASSAYKAERIFKKPRVDDSHMDGFRSGMTTQTGMGTGSAYGSSFNFGGGTFGVTSMSNFTGYHNKPNSARDIPPWEVRKLLASKARKDIYNKLNEIRLSAEAKAVVKGKAGQKNRMRPKSKVNSDEHDVKITSEPSICQDTADDSNEEEPVPVTINVPDPDFYNFDLNRAESSFAEDQVWAAYDDDDGMPRFYARIHKVISLNPFRMRISWLNSRSNSELGPIDWVGSGFSKTCGDFRTGRHELSESLNSFSHRVDYIKGTRGLIRIFPQKGDAWALYRNWSPDWNESTPDELIHKYDMVEVLDDYNEEQGVSVATLDKVPGFKTVFQRNTDMEKIKKIPREEMFRFSHQVPYYLLTGEEAPNAPQGCLELDPAATPLELLDVDSDPTGASEMQNGKSEKETLQRS